MGRINISLDTRYPVTEKLVIEADLAAPEPSPTVVSAANSRAPLAPPEVTVKVLVKSRCDQP